MIISNPFQPSATIEGEIIQPGEVLQATDFYASTAGKWEICPCPGVHVEAGTDVVWVRPRIAESVVLPPLTEEHVMQTCRPGAGHETCRYLGMSASGWRCVKHSGDAEYLDESVRLKTINARGDNCEGRT